MTSPLNKIPLPSLHTSGAAFANEKQASWWPVDEKSEQRQAEIENAPDATTAASRTHHNNHAWIHAARRHLLDYNEPFRSGSHKEISGPVAGHIARALLQMRDERVAFDSLKGITENMRTGQDILHRDVLSAVELLQSVDWNSRQQTSFREDSLPVLEPSKAAKKKTTKEAEG